MEKARPSLEEVFSPRGVAVVGASASGTGFASRFTLALKASGYPAIYPVNPRYTEVFGLPCYPSVREIPGIVDHVVVAVPAESVLDLLDDCAAKGVRSVHFFTAGFSESGYAERAELERAMLEKARAGGFRILGPNCLGLYVPRNRLVIFSEAPLEPGPVAFISQSGGYAEDLPYVSAPRGLRFSKVVSYGNALDIDECELLEYLSHDPETEIIAAYVEGVKDGRRFLRVLGEAAARKPVVICKGGTTEAGLRAARGHTASLTSSVAVFDALCRQTGTIPVDNIEDLTDILVALRFVRPLPRGTGVAVVGAGGGPSVSAGDEMEKAGLRAPRLSREIQEELKQCLPLAGSIFVNPVDTPNLTSPDAISTAVGIVSKSPDIDMVVYHLGFHPLSRWGDGRFSSPGFLDAATRALRQATDKPVLLALRSPVSIGGMKDFLAAQRAFVNAGFPVFYSLQQAARSIAGVLEWNRRRST